MTEKRAQGRPARGADEVGQDRIVEGMRLVLRERPRSEITRNDIARCAGVTPALISYYFPDRDDLVAAATGPVVESYAAQVAAILQSGNSPREQLRQLIGLLVVCHIKDARLLEAFRHHMTLRRSTAGPDHLALMARDSSSVIRAWLETVSPCTENTEFLCDAIWGICEFVARKPLTGEGAAQSRHAGKEAELIYAFVVGAMRFEGQRDKLGDVLIDALPIKNLSARRGVAC